MYCPRRAGPKLPTWRHRLSATVHVTAYPALILSVIFAAQLGIFFLMAINRVIDGDEGFYLLASKLVFEHKLPYRDFFYQQAPLLPYCYGLWLKLTGPSWLGARSFSVLVSASIGTLLYDHVRRETKRSMAGLFAIILYVSSADILGWFTTVKTYALTSLFLFSAYVVLNRTTAHLRVAPFVSGLLLGFCVDTRSYLVIVFILFTSWLHSQPKVLWHFLIGFTLAVSPNLYFVVASPKAFWFDNLGYHAIRNTQGVLVGEFGQKLDVLSQVPGDFMLCWLLVFAVIMPSQSPHARRALACGISVMLVSLLPTPTFLQYFCVVVPFLIVPVVCGVFENIQHSETVGARRMAVGFYSFIILIAVSASWMHGLYGQFLHGLPGMLPNWKWSTAAEVSAAIDEFTATGESVFSSWPGYVFGSHAAQLAGAENQFGLACARELSPVARKEFRILSDTEIETVINRHQVRIVAVGDASTPPGMTPSPPYHKWLVNAGYQRKRTIGGISVWALRTIP